MSTTETQTAEDSGSSSWDTLKQARKNKSGLRLAGTRRIRRQAAKRFMPRQTDITSKNCRPIMVVLRNGKVHVVDPKRAFSGDSSSSFSRPPKRARYRREEDSSSLSSCASNAENDDNSAANQIMPPPSMNAATEIVKSLPAITSRDGATTNENAADSATAASMVLTTPIPMQASAANSTTEPSLTKMLPSTDAIAAATTPKRSNIPKRKLLLRPKGNRLPPSLPRTSETTPLPTKMSKRIKNQKERKAKAVEEQTETKQPEKTKQKRSEDHKEENREATEGKPQHAMKKVAAFKPKPTAKAAPSANPTPAPPKPKVPVLCVSPPKKGRNKPRVPIYSTTSNYRVKTPSDKDVIFGRGNGVACHLGNVLFRSYIWNAREDYARADRICKNIVAERVCEMIREAGGKFLVKDPGGVYWVEANDRKALEKACQALREQKWNPDNKPVLHSEEPQALLEPEKKKPKKNKEKATKQKDGLVKKAMTKKIKVPKSDTSKPLPKARTSKGKSAEEPASTAAATPRTSMSSTTGSLSAVVSVGSTPERAPPAHELMSPSPPNGSISSNVDGSAKTTNTRAVPSHLRNGSSPSPSPNQDVLLSNVDSILGRKPVALDAGTRISVYWPLDKAYYDATVRKRKGSIHFIEYNADGVTEWLDLSRQTFKVVSIPQSLKWFPDDEQW